MLVLRELKTADEDAFLQGDKSWRGEDLSWFTFVWSEGDLFSDHLLRLEKNKKGKDLPENHVPDTMLYGFVEREIVGRVNIRHELNKNLAWRGGHIGYSVAPKFWKRGYATEMMKQSLSVCKGIGLKEILITCGVENEPSWKVIESVGGKLKDEVWDDVDKEMIRKYWVSLK